MPQSFFDRVFAWHRLWSVLGLLKLNRFRNRMRKENLVDTGTLPTAPPALSAPTAEQKASRSADGSYNDFDGTGSGNFKDKGRMGSAGTRLGRNLPLNEIVTPDKVNLLAPSPREISRWLLTRDPFIPATSLNLLAAAWIQFQVHDWFSHKNDKTAPPIEVPLKDDDPWPKRPMLVNPTQSDPTRTDGGLPQTFINAETHWWDGSQLYGSDLATQLSVRSMTDGKLKLDGDKRLPVNADGIDITGVNANWWLGLSLMHTLFTYEHNAICDRLKQANPAWTDEQLFQRARLINAAVMAKIHTVEWTPGILAHPTIEIGMNNNWTEIRKSKAEHHAAPYSMTEEFVAVYRMHPLMPDDYVFRSLPTGAVLLERNFEEIAAGQARVVMEQVSLTDLFYSFGVAHPGAITLHNYPKFLQNLRRGTDLKMDLAAVDILRDRERGVPRYNTFRRLMGLDVIEKWEDLSANPAWVAEIRQLYHDDLDAVDLMIGMYAEPLIEGLGFSETAFRVFLLMASRRLQSDRFFTTDYNAQTYTQTGLQWIEDANMTSVITRHFPALGPLLRNQKNAFAPWPSH